MFQTLKTLGAIEILLVMAIVVFKYLVGDKEKNLINSKIIFITLFTPCVALLSGNIYVFYFYLFCIVAFSSRSSSEAARIYVTVLPSVPILGQETGLAGVYIAQLTTVLAINLGATISYFITSKNKKGLKNLYYVCVLLIIAIFTYIYGREANVISFVRTVLIYIIGFLGPFMIIYRGVGNRQDIERLLLTLVYGGAVCSVVAMFQASRHWILYQQFYNALNVEFLVGGYTMAMRGGFVRTGGTMLDYSAAGVFLAVTLSIMPFLRPQFQKARYRLLVTLLLTGLFVTQSRGAWIAAIVGFVFIMLYRGRYTIAALVMGVGAGAEAMILLFAKTGRLADIGGMTSEASGTVVYRSQLASRGMEQIQAHLLFGQTQQQLISNLPDLVQGQGIVDFINAHLFIAMAAGVPLFCVWVAVWTVPVVQAWRLRRFPSSNRDLAEIPAAMIVPAMVAIFATSIVDRNLVWPTIALGLAGPCFALARRDTGKGAPPSRRKPLVQGRLSGIGVIAPGQS